MNKGFAYYFKQAFKMSAQTVFRNKNLLKSMVYFFMSIVARLTVILGALVELADVRQAKITKTSRTVDIPQSLTRASQKPLWTMIVARILEVLIYLGGFLLLSIVCGAIFAVGLAITQFVGTEYFTLVCVIFAVPCLIIYAIYTIIVTAMFAPTAYVIDTNPSLTAGDVVSVCVNSMKNRGKMTVILSVFIPSLIIGAIVGVCAAVFAVIFIIGAGKFTLLLTVLWSIVSACLLGLTVPVFNMTQNLALVLLFEDIALDPVNANKRTAGINIKKISGARVDREEIADNLTALFDEGIEEKTPDPDELVHKHKKRKKKVEQQPAAATATPLAGVDENSSATFEEVDDYADEAPAPVSEAAQQPDPAPAPEPAPVNQTAQQPAQPMPGAQQPPRPAQPMSGAQQPPRPAQPMPGEQQPPRPAQPMPGAQQPPRPAQPMPGAQQPPRPAQPMPGAQQPPRPAQPMPGAQQPPRPAQPMPGAQQPPRPAQPMPGAQQPPRPAQPMPGAQQPPRPAQPMPGAQQPPRPAQPMPGAQQPPRPAQPMPGAQQPPRPAQPMAGAQQPPRPAQPRTAPPRPAQPPQGNGGNAGNGGLN